MVTIATPAEQRILLQNISWQTFKTMLAEMGAERGFRLAYDSGIVEIMSPLMPHENSNRLIEGFIVVLCEELDLEIKRTGSLTMTRDDLERGAEPKPSAVARVGGSGGSAAGTRIGNTTVGRLRGLPIGTFALGTDRGSDSTSEPYLPIQS